MSAAITPWQRSFDLLDPFRTELEDVFHRFLGPTGNGRAAWSPRVDVRETDKEFQIKADLPGVDPKDVEVAVTNGVLTLRGEKKEEKEEKKAGYHRVERFAGQFYREIPLPAAADADKVTATSAKGVVTVTVAKKVEAQPKKVAVTPKD